MLAVGSGPQVYPGAGNLHKADCVVQCLFTNSTKETAMGNPAGVRLKKKEKRRKKHELRLAAKTKPAPAKK